MPLLAEQVVELLLAVHDSLADATVSDRHASLPSVVLLTAESGRGKTFAAQRLLDELATRVDGYWQPGLAPQWPPLSVNAVHRHRKTVVPPPGQLGRPPQFFWLGIGCGELRHLGVDLKTEAVGQLLEQAAALAHAAVSDHSKTALRRAVLGFGLDIAEAALAAGPGLVVDLGRRVRQFIGERRPQSYLDGLRSQLEQFLLILRRLDEVPPLVVVLDDAHAVDDGTLRLLSVLLGAQIVSQPVEPLDILDRERGVDADWHPLDTNASNYFPGPVYPPLPVMLLATAWPSRELGAFADTPFSHWLGEAEAHGFLTRAEIRDPSLDEALPTLKAAGLGDAIEQRVLAHLSTNDGRVIPLVMAQAVAELEERRDHLSGDKLAVKDSFIEALPRDPEQRLREWLHDLRDDAAGNGRLSYSVLRRLALWGIRPPVSLVAAVLLDEGLEAEVVRTATEQIVDALSRHGILHYVHEEESLQDSTGSNLGGPLMQFRQLVLEIDVVEPLSRDSVFADEAAAAAARVLELSLRAMERELEWDAYIPSFRLVEILRPGARLVGASQSMEVSGDLAAFSAFLTEECLLREPTGLSCLGRLIWWSQHETLQQDLDPVIDEIERSRPNRWAVLNAGRVLRARPSRTQLERLEAALARLAANARPHLILLLPWAACLRELERFDQAIRVLGPAAARSEIAAVRVVALYETRGGEGWLEEAIAVLEPLAERFETAAVKLVDLYERRGREGWLPEAIAVLEPLAERFETAAVKLVDLYETRGGGGWLEEAIAVLEPLAERFEHSSVKLVDLYERRRSEGWLEEAIAVLEPLAERFETAAVKLVDLYERRGREGWLPEAITVLEPLAERFENAGKKLVELYEKRGGVGWLEKAVAVLEPLAERFGNAALNLADLYEKWGGEGGLEKAIAVLEPLAERFENAAVKLADFYEKRGGEGGLEKAIAVLEPLAGRVEIAALRLAKLYEKRGGEGWLEKAVAILTPHAIRSPYATFDLTLLWLKAGDDGIRRAKHTLRSNYNAKNPYLAGLNAGIALLQSLDVGRVQEVWAVLWAQSFVRAVSRVFRTRPETQPCSWNRFFSHRWPSKTRAAATRFVASWIVEISQGAFPGDSFEWAVTQAVTRIWPQPTEREKTAKFLYRELTFWVDGAFAGGTPLAIEPEERVLAIAETLKRLQGTSPRRPSALDELLDRVVRTLIDRCGASTDLRARLESCEEWSSVAQVVLQRPE